MKLLSLRDALRRGFSIQDPTAARKLGDTIELRRVRLESTNGELRYDQRIICVVLQTEAELALYNQKP